MAVDLTNTDTQTLWDQIISGGATAYGASGLPDPLGIAQTFAPGSTIQPVTVTPMQTLPTSSATPDNSIFDTAGNLLGYILQQAGAGVYAVGDAAGNMVGMLYNNASVAGGIDAVSAAGAYIGKFIAQVGQDIAQTVQTTVKDITKGAGDLATGVETYMKYGFYAVMAVLGVIVLVEVIKVVKD